MRSIVGAMLFGLAGCAREAPPTAGPSAAPSAHPAEVTTASAPTTGAFEVHEWGLVDVDASTARIQAGPPGGPTNWNGPRRKPVLYFHLASGSSEALANVEISMPSPGIVERFPAGELSPDRTSLAWSGLRIRKGSCHVVGAPTRDAPLCQTSDGLCEAAELAKYETADADCIEGTDGARYNHLFYRGTGPAPLLPLEVAVRGATIEITHARAADASGPILYVHDAGGASTVSTLDLPSIGASVKASPPEKSDVASARAALDDAMRKSGLTAEEIGAFDRAWANDLFGDAAGREAPARRGAPAPRDFLLFVMPPSLLDAASKVTVRPVPSALRRFLLVRLFV